MAPSHLWPLHLLVLLALNELLLDNLHSPSHCPNPFGGDVPSWRLESSADEASSFAVEWKQSSHSTDHRKRSRRCMHVSKHPLPSHSACILGYDTYVCTLSGTLLTSVLECLLRCALWSEVITILFLFLLASLITLV